MEKIGILQSMELFRNLAPGQIQLFTEKLQPGAYSPGQVIIEEGRGGEFLFIIHTGTVRVYRDFGGSLIDVTLLHPYQNFGEMSLIDDGPHSASVKAESAVALWKLHKPDFLDILALDAGLAAQVWQNLSRILTARIRATTNQVRDYFGLNRALIEDDRFREFYRNFHR